LKQAQLTPATGPPQLVVMGGGRGGGPRSRLNLGVKGSGVFGGDVALVDAAATVLDVGRVDVASEDGVWFSDGLTDRGRAAIKVMETNGMVVNLVSPSSKLLASVLSAVQKPIAVSGTVTLDADAVAKIKEKNSAIVIQCDAADAKGCVGKLEDAKKKFGSADNLVLSAASGPKMDDFKQVLYLGLVKAGWSKDDIYAMAGAAAGQQRPLGNLTRFTTLPPAGQGRGF
jgi:hypothetical protein